MKKLVVSAIILLISINILNAQDAKINELENRIIKLEERIKILEEMVLKKTEFEINEMKELALRKENWRKLSVGMKEDEVIKILGEPIHINKFGVDFVIWTYINKYNGGEITFDKKGVRSWNEPDF